MATIIAKVKVELLGFRTSNGTRKAATGRPRYSVYRVLIDGAYYYLRFSGDPKLPIGTDVNLNALSYNYCNSNGDITSDQSDPTTGDGSGDGSGTGIGDGSGGSNNDELPDPDDTDNYPKNDDPLQ